MTSRDSVESVEVGDRDCGEKGEESDDTRRARNHANTSHAPKAQKALGYSMEETTPRIDNKRVWVDLDNGGAGQRNW